MQAPKLAAELNKMREFADSGKIAGQGQSMGSKGDADFPVGLRA